MNISVQMFCALCMLLFCGLTSCGKTDHTGGVDQTRQAMRGPKQDGKLRLMIAVVNQSPSIEDSLAGRFDAALNLIATALPEQFELVTLQQRNDAIRTLEAQGQEPTAAKIADELDVDRLLFFRAVRLENMLRVAMTMTQAPDFLKSTEGTGYALIRYRNEETGNRIYDTAILEALQRALADAIGDSAMFAQAEPPLARVQPVPTLVIGGISFGDHGTRPVWEIFSDKISVSYEMVLQIFDAVRETPRYVVYDIDSRDSMYAVRKLYMVENYRRPSSLEMQILEQFEVHYLISGSLERTAKDEAVLTLQLGELNRGMYRQIAQQKTTIREDSREELMQSVRTLASALLKQ